MKSASFQIPALLFLSLLTTASAQNVSTGVSIVNGDLKSFYFAIGDYYRVPESRVVYVRDHYHVPDEELPVLFFLANHVHVEPQVIVDLRMRRRMSWLDITFHYGLTPAVYYVPMTRVGPPYGNAYGYYKKYGKDSKRVVLADKDVVNLVNLRFMSKYHGIPPEVVMDRRGKGEKFVAINKNLRKEKQAKVGTQGKGKDKGQSSDSGQAKNKGQSEGKGKGNGNKGQGNGGK